MQCLVFPALVLALVGPAAAPRFQALRYEPAAGWTTWKVLDRDGANRQVEPYLSSLGGGESGTGIVASPEFAIEVDSISMTLCGHDAMGGGGKKNFVALVDAAPKETLRTTYAPLSDAMKEASWDVRDLRGRRARFEAHDGDSGAAFAWLGVGRIDAGPALRVDFRQGLPSGWTSTTPKIAVRTEPVGGAIPFLALASVDSMVAAGGSAEIPCGFSARRLFFLGGTVEDGFPLDVCGTIEIRYRDGSSERHPLMVGYTLERSHKAVWPTKALRLHPSSDPFQGWFAVRPADRPIESIRIADEPTRPGAPRITAVTCETSEASERLVPLPGTDVPPEAAAWIEARSISAESPSLDEVKEEIRRAHRLDPPEGPRALRFERVPISDRTYEAASAFDVDGDGRKDIVSGAWWYAGPDFKAAHKITDVAPAGEYWDDFSDYPMDVDGDGRTDIVTGAFFGGPLRWLRNPGVAGKEWTVHPIEQVGAIETTRFWDVDGDGFVEVVPNASGNVVFFRLVRGPDGKGTGRFTKHVAKLGGCGHGLGFGDIDGDGRGDFVVPDAWIRAPEDPLSGEWTWQDDGFRLGTASVPILVHDVDRDGAADLIVGQAHDYGLDWYRQVRGADGKRSWEKRSIDRSSSQYHDMALADLDRDGELELVTGKRYRAHNGNDPGAADPVFVRYFDIDRGAFVCHTIDRGPAGRASGVGIYFWVEDLDGDGWLDLVAPGKDGLQVFRNRGRP